MAKKRPKKTVKLVNKVFSVLFINKKMLPLQNNCDIVI